LNKADKGAGYIRRIFPKAAVLAAAAALPLLLSSCSMILSDNRGNYTWGWFTVSPLTSRGRESLSFLLEGLLPTISASFISLFISITIGIIISLAGISQNRVLKMINRIWVETFRSIPVLVMLLWTYYGLPVSLGINLNVFTAVVIALSLCDSAFEAEIFRAGLQSIPKSQYEAARIEGCPEFNVIRYIIMPQAVRNILPPLVNQFAYMLKISSIASVIGFAELTRKANELTVIQYRPLEIYTVLVLEYLVLVLIVSWVARKIEKSLSGNAVD